MIKNQLSSYIDEYKDILKGVQVAVAVSGGIDSLALLFAAKEWAEVNDSRIIGITVDHKLRKESEAEATHVNELCRKYGIKHQVLVWEGEKPTTNVESSARENRYKLISGFCGQNSIKYLLVAHHLQDQAETFFLRLFRGSGLDGLAAMKGMTNLYNMTIIRPFLRVNKDILRQYLLKNSIGWIEDPSNSDEKYLRNKIRNFLNSFDDKDKILERINFAVDEINKSKEFREQEIGKIEKKVVNFSLFGSCAIDRQKLLLQNEEIILKLLAKVAMKISGNVYKPRLEKLKRLLKHIMEIDDIKYTFYGCIFEKYNNNLLMVYREYNSIGEDKELIYNTEVIWDGRFRIILMKQMKNLTITHVKNGEFNVILESVRKTNFSKYKEMKEIKGIEKHIFHTLPMVSNGKDYLIDYDGIKIVPV
ncbi:MAG: tRNA lysidine(34) synthetase TilS [Rickettsiales bacterium]|jgi:tRNA(Ile)-lysidine synthase|nr:tRNA lysidine(34) synthetase TilS [Rickettsiales bacterium]